MTNELLDPDECPRLTTINENIDRCTKAEVDTDFFEILGDVYDAGVQAAHREPLDMLIFCPKCGKQHIDRPDPEIRVPTETLNRFYDATGGISGPDPDLYGRLCEAEFQSLNKDRWTNPVHKSHTCRTEDGGCGLIFRIADFPTNGVAAIKTRGKDDTYQPEEA